MIYKLEIKKKKGCQLENCDIVLEFWNNLHMAKNMLADRIHIKIQ